MKLIQDPRCYTDMCIDGVWFHYDHCGTKVYMLKGESAPEFDLAGEPTTEEELLALLEPIAKGLK